MSADKGAYQHSGLHTALTCVNMLAMSSYEQQLATVRQMDDDIEGIIGRKVFGYISKPTETSYRITFGDGHVCLSMNEAVAYMTSLLTTAQSDPSRLPWPLCEPVIP